MYYEGNQNEDISWRREKMKSSLGEMGRGVITPTAYISFCPLWVEPAMSSIYSRIVTN